MSDIKKLTKTELEFMELVWDSTQDMCLRDFVKIFKEVYKKKWERSTFSVYLNKLTKKGYLQYYRKGKVFYYHQIISRLEYRQNMLNSTFEKVYNTNMEGVIACYCGIKNPTNDDLLRIRKWLKEQGA